MKLLCTHPNKSHCKTSWCSNQELCGRQNEAILLHDVLVLVQNHQGDVIDEFAWLLKEYGHESDENLTKDAIALKKRILAVVQKDREEHNKRILEVRDWLVRDARLYTRKLEIRHRFEELLKS